VPLWRRRNLSEKSGVIDDRDRQPTMLAVRRAAARL